jgi:hypothetical protein
LATPPATAARETSTVRRLLVDAAGWWPPLLAWLAALTGLWIIALLTGHHPWHAETWARWDSSLYESIARHGYEVHRCGSTGHTKWCGNTAWFPGYPLLMAGLHVLGLPLFVAGVVLSWLFSATALVLIWRAFLRDMPSRVAAVGGLFYAAWAPGQVYEFAVYPLSMLVVFILAYLHFLRQNRWLAAGLMGAGAALTYPVGLTLAVVAVVWVTVTLERGRVRAIAASAAPLPLAFLLILVVQRAQTGRWSALFDVQSTYDHGLHNPFGAIFNALILWSRTQSLASENVKALQTLAVSALLLAILLTIVLRRTRPARLELLFLLSAAVTWALPLSQGNISVQRSQAALLPVAVLVARLPRPLLVVAIAATVALSIPVARLYFDGLLV